MRLIGVGTGPGDPELVTRQGGAGAAEADLVLVPVLALDDVGRAEATVRAHVRHDRVQRVVFAMSDGDRRRGDAWDAAAACARRRVRRRRAHGRLRHDRRPQHLLDVHLPGPDRARAAARRRRRDGARHHRDARPCRPQRHRAVRGHRIARADAADRRRRDLRRGDRALRHRRRLQGRALDRRRSPRSCAATTGSTTAVYGGGARPRRRADRATGRPLSTRRRRPGARTCRPSSRRPSAPRRAASCERRTSDAEPGRGKVTFVGAGPGAADLLTFRAAAAIAAADIVIWADQPGARGRAAARPRRRRDRRQRPAAARGRARDLPAGRGRAAAGRPHPFGRPEPVGRGAGAARSGRRRSGSQTEIVPGVSAFSAVAAIVQRELTIPEVAQSVILTRLEGGKTPMPPGEQVREFARHGTTMAIFLSAARSGQLQEELTRRRLPRRHPRRDRLPGHAGRTS